MRRMWIVALASVAAACGSRADVWDDPVRTPQVVGLVDKVALVDDGAHRVLLVGADAALDATRLSVPVGHSVVAARASADKTRLFVLSAGDNPRRSSDDDRPRLTVIEPSGARSFPLESPHSGIELDPLGRFVAVFAGSSAASGGSFVENPNEIVLIDLQAPAGQSGIVPRTLRSFGGRPQRITFTKPLGLAAGQRRLLVVETEQDVALIDLDKLYEQPARPEITVRLNSGSSTTALRPAGLVVDDGDPTKNDDARIGVRLENDSSVVTLTLGPAKKGAPNDFQPEINLTDVGGQASDLAFVDTDAGRRLAALVPSRAAAVLVDPQTSVTTDVTLAAAYSRLALVTDVVGGAGADVALLYGGSGQSGVAFWSLGRASGQPYRSVEVVPIQGSVERVLDVPAPNQALKVLQTSGGSGFFVLDLVGRTAAPLSTATAPSMLVSDDGLRLWAYASGGRDVARISLDNLHPAPVSLDRLIGSAFEITRVGGGHALAAVDVRGSAAITFVDAEVPDPATARSFSGLLLEELP